MLHPVLRRKQPSPTMYLKEIEHRPAEGMMGVAFTKLREGGHAVPEIMHLFRFKQRNTGHLVRFTEEVMRGTSALSQGMRELIGTYVSKKSHCSFCSCAHAPVAAHLLGTDVVEEVLENLETSRLAAKDKELLRYVGKVAENAAGITAADVDRVKAAGWSEEAIYDALTVASLFKFYNTWNSGSGVQNMRAADYLGSAQRLIQMGYCMDFSFRSVLKVMWVGRKEINYNDLKMLVQMMIRRFLSLFGIRLNPAPDPNKEGNRPAAAPIFSELEKGF